MFSLLALHEALLGMVWKIMNGVKIVMRGRVKEKWIVWFFGIKIDELSYNKTNIDAIMGAVEVDKWTCEMGGFWICFCFFLNFFGLSITFSPKRKKFITMTSASEQLLPLLASPFSILMSSPRCIDMVFSAVFLCFLSPFAKQCMDRDDSSCHYFHVDISHAETRQLIPIPSWLFLPHNFSKSPSLALLTPYTFSHRTPPVIAFFYCHCPDQ